jgi:hypothetical protein
MAKAALRFWTTSTKTLLSLHALIFEVDRYPVTKKRKTNKEHGEGENPWSVLFL